MASISVKLGLSTATILTLLSLNSCATLSYYRQSVSGHMEIMRKSRPIEIILKDETTAPELKHNLQQAVEIRKYASTALLLPENDSYSKYVDLGRPYVVWNVVATPEFSLEPLSWCFPVVGCLTYRGYFSKDTAISYAADLQAQGYDVHIAGVTAYSTLGWFADPLVNTMLQNGQVNLARVIFHELAHQLIYFADDTDFNEAFADAIAEYGVRRWLMDNNLQAELKAFDQTLASENQFNMLIFKYKAELENLYHLPLDEDELRRRKQEVFNRMVQEYELSHATWPAPDDYSAWFKSGMNNAKLALVLTYRDLVSDFKAVLVREHYDLQKFYRTIGELRHCDKTARRRFLASNLPNISC